MDKQPYLGRERQASKFFMIALLMLIYVLLSSQIIVSGDVNETSLQNDTNVVDSEINNMSGNISINASRETSFGFRINITGLYKNESHTNISGVIFAYEVKENKTFADVNLTNSSHESNSTLNDTLDASTYDEGKIVPVELDIHPGGIGSNFTICTYYVNKTRRFECTLEEEYTTDGYYTIQGTAEYEKKEFYLNKIINISPYRNISGYISLSPQAPKTMANATDNFTEFGINSTNLSSEVNESIDDNVTVTQIDSNIIERDGITKEERFNITLGFKELYKGRHISGTISLRENRTDVLEGVELNIVPAQEPSNLTICHYNVNGTERFNCTLDYLKSGIHKIEATAERRGNVYSVSETTYIDIPEQRIEVEMTKLSGAEGDYRVDDAVLVSPRLMLGNELIDDEEISLEIVSPDNSSYTVTDTMPEFGLILQEKGNYSIRANASFYGIEIQALDSVEVSPASISEPNRTISLDREEKDDIFTSRNFSITPILERVYEKDKLVEMGFSLVSAQNISLENVSVDVSVTDPENTTYTLGVRNSRENYSAEFFALAEGEYIVDFRADNRTDSRTISIVNRTEFIKERHIIPAIEKGLRTAARKMKTKGSIMMEESEMEESEMDENGTATKQNISQNISQNMSYDVSSNNASEVLSGEGMQLDNDTSVSDKETFQDKVLLRNITWIDVSETKDNLSSIRLGFERDSASVKFYGGENPETIESIQTVSVSEPPLATEIFALDSVQDGFNFSIAELSLRKKSEVDEIIYCRNWSYETASCREWEATDIDFQQNSTHISFNVTHFTAYAGGSESNSSLVIYDTSDEDKENITVFINMTSVFYANYTDNSTNLSIGDAECNITLENYHETVMGFDAERELYSKEFNVTERGFYEYNISCSHDSYDDLFATDNITVFSYANITFVDAENTSLGEESELSAEIRDHFNSTILEGHNVSFYSDKDGYLGSEETSQEGMAVLNFTPESIGIHTITYMLDDSRENYYYALYDETAKDMEVFGTALSVTRSILYDGKNTYNVSLLVKNRIGRSIENITASDFVPEEFYPSGYSSAPWNSSSSTLGGMFLFWNITSIDPLGEQELEYQLSYEDSTDKPDTGEAGRIGITHR